MSKYRLHIIAQWVAVVLLLILFCYFRIKPIYFQTVPYTYDQGRDFMKAEEIIRYQNPTFIGPTTGIQGLHHGAWWYYFLSIVFVIFNGWPPGFYYGIFAFTLVTTILFFLFLKREFGFLPSFLFLLIVTSSPYFIRISFFPGNNILTPGAILLFIYGTYNVLKTKQLRYYFISTLAIGLIFETEVSFGIFLIPGFILLSFIYEEFRPMWRNRKVFMASFIGFVLPFVPRILFNLKNGFIEITSSLHFLKTTPPTNPQSLVGVFGDRGDLFVRYYLDTIWDHSLSISVALIFFVLASFVFGLKTSKMHQIRAFIFSMLTLCFIFIFSLMNKDNFFWDNYLEGIQYFFVFMIVLGFVFLAQVPKMSRALYIVTALFITIAVMMFVRDQAQKKQAIPSIGLLADTRTVEYVYSQVKKDDFCVDVYTPPRVPYTYMYLFSYYSKVKGFKWPHEGPYQGKCWYIIDRDEYSERIDVWRKEHIPEQAKKKSEKVMENGARVELWSL